jgi:hypothetical protein
MNFKESVLECFKSSLDYSSLIKGDKKFFIKSPFFNLINKEFNDFNFNDLESEKLSSNSLNMFFSFFNETKNINKQLANYKEILKSGDVLLMTILGGQSLKELREAFLFADSHFDRLVYRVIPMLKVEGLANYAQSLFKSSAITKEIKTFQFNCFESLIKFLRENKLTANYFMNDVFKCELECYTKAKNYYESKFNLDDKIYLTFEVFSLVAFI